MLTEEQLIAYLEGALSPEERARVEDALARDETLRHRVLDQRAMDAALHSALGGAGANERIRQSVLAVVRGEQDEALKRRVLKDTVEVKQSSSSTLADWLAGWFRRPAWASGFAVAVLLLCGVAWWWRGTHEVARAMELPELVQAGGAVVLRSGATFPVGADYQPQRGDELRLAATNSGTLRFADGTAVHLQAGSRLRLSGAKTRAAGKQFTLLDGSLSAIVAKQPPGRPLLIHTPHAVATVLGTEFELSVGTNQTQLDVTAGAVALARPSEKQPVTVRAGEYAVASPGSAPFARPFGRNPNQWPFSSASTWNRPLGSGARFEPVTARPFLADGPLVEAALPRRVYRGGPADTLRGVWVNGERRAEVRLADGTPLPQGVDTFTLLQPGRRASMELFNVRTRADGDIEAEAVVELDLAGLGAGAAPGPAQPFGFSSLGGLLRASERERDVSHALAARVDKSRINVRPPGGGVCVWPATNAIRLPPANGEVAGNVHIGTLLALPPEVKVNELGLPPTMLPLARALQDFGVYVVGPGPRPFALMVEGQAWSAELDAALNRLVPLLQVVANNTPQTPGGGGEPRRPAAPAFPGEVPLSR